MQTLPEQAVWTLCSFYRGQFFQVIHLKVPSKAEKLSKYSWKLCTLLSTLPVKHPSQD